MHRLKSFLLLYKAFLFLGFLVEFVSSCTPDNGDKNPISISLTSSNGWRINMSQRLALPNTDIIGFNSGFQPDYNEIFLLAQPIPGVYEFRAYEQFYETAVIEVPIDALNVGAGFKINNSTNGDNQRFHIDCNACNLQTNSEDFAPYHTSCLITNVKSGFCIGGIDSNVKISQADCATASRWDIYGRKIPDGLTITSNSQESTTVPAQGCQGSNFDNSTSLKPFSIHLSMFDLVAIVFGSMMSTTIVVIMIGYCCWRRKQYKVNNQNVQHKDNDQYERNDQYEENGRGNVQIYDDIK